MTLERAARSVSVAAFLLAAASCGPKSADPEGGITTGGSSAATVVTGGSLMDTGDSSSTMDIDGDGPTVTGDVLPEICVPKEFDDTEARRLCTQYVDVKSCCGARSLATGTDGDEGIIPGCMSSFDTTDQGTTPAPAECPQLVGAAFDCAISVAAESCADLRHLVDAIWAAYDNAKGNQPPPDTSMPCHAEIIMAWEAGCEPNML